MSTAALFITIAKKWKQSKCPSIDEWINKMWHIHTMEYYSSVKRNEVLTHAATGMNLENIMLSGRSQARNDSIYMKCPEQAYLQIQKADSWACRAGGDGQGA